jgi:lauroyl/myristoyl acyltransferase
VKFFGMHFGTWDSMRFMVVDCGGTYGSYGGSKLEAVYGMTPWGKFLGKKNGIFGSYLIDFI